METGRAEVLRLENEHLRFVMHADASADLVDKAGGRKWRMPPVAVQDWGTMEEGHAWPRTGRTYGDRYPGRFVAEPEGDHVHLTLLGRLGRPIGTFRCRFWLEGPWLGVEVPDIDEEIPSLVFPPPVESEALVLPYHQGRLIREPLNKFAHSVYVYAGNVLNMRWFGGLREENGWICVVQDGYADAAVLQAGAWAAPMWLKSLGRWNGPRRLRYRFVEGGYVGLAKAFRQWAQQKGLFRTLKEKIEDVPSLANMVGGRNLHFMMGWTFQRDRYDEIWMPVPKRLDERGEGVVPLVTFRQAAQIIEDAKRLGMRRGVLSYHGWIKGGYDESHPDIWPPEPALGTIQELKDLCRPDGPFVAHLHDNYQDIYEQSASFPAGTCRQQDGTPLPGGFWRGGQAYILNARDAFECARRNWPHLRELGAECIYCDTLTAETLKQSYEPGNTLSRAEDLEWKRRTMAFFKEQGVIFGSENGCDFGVHYLDCAPHGKHTRVPGESVPLWALVYHDCVLGWRGGAALQPQQFRTRCLENILWGCAVAFGQFTAQNWPEYRQAFADSLFVDDWHARIGTDEMVNHRYLSDDCLLEQSEWSSGVAVIVNFAEEDRTVDGVRVPANDYVILD